MFEVVVAVVGPEAAVVEAEDVVDPVGLSGDSRRPLVGGRAPVVRSVGGTSSNGVCGQDLSSSAVVTTLLSCGELRTDEGFRKTMSRSNLQVLLSSKTYC